MPNSDDPKKKQQDTLAWDPEEVAALHETEAAEARAREEEEDPLLGQLLRGKWRVLSRLGAGSFGTVYKVRDEKGGWIEALKILGVDRITGAEAETARKRFLREAQIMKHLGNESQHIVGLSTYEEDLEAGLVYFLMEFVEGKSLADVVQEEGPLAPERILRLAQQVCDALIVAHEGPDAVVHRDLKLENIMLTRDRAGEETVKVLDFGIAKLARRDADSRLTTVGTLGTPGYAAPEQLRAENVDGRTDLFAFGVILYALLTARDPWMGNPAGTPTTQIYELMLATDRGEVRPMEDSGVDVPPALAHVVLRLLRRDPGERFDSARELREALERIAAGGVASDVASLRVITESPGVEVEIRHGRRTVAEGPTPCVANGLEPGSYRVSIRDARFESVETTVELEAGAVEDVTVVATLRARGVASGMRRRPGLVATVVLVVALAAAAAAIRPWGRTLDMSGLRTAVASGSVRQAWLTRAGIEGTLTALFVPVPFRTPVSEGDMAAAVQTLEQAGLSVDTSWEVARLLGEAVQAQADDRYFGHDGDDVQGYAQRIETLDPANPEAHSLLLKVAEHMAWDADAAREDGEAERARELTDACLALVPDYPHCRSAQAEPGVEP